jgi:hypothetical protein
MIEMFILLISFMTIKKKLIAIGVAIALLSAFFIWNPGWNISSLSSSVVIGTRSPNPIGFHDTATCSLIE